MTAYGAPGQTLTIYEIDPTVKRLAEDPRYFTYLRDTKAKYEIVLGDARLQLAEHGKPGQYGVIVVDAFSSDAIPVHLLTKEAVQLYLDRLAPDGLIALHISNRYLDLKPVAARIAAELGLVGLEQWDSDATAPGKQSSQWVVLARKKADFAGLPDQTTETEKDNKKETTKRWMPLEAPAGAPLWTDAFSNLLQIFNWSQLRPWQEK
jgi:spermidine synthase